MAAANNNRRQIKPDEVDDFDELLSEALDDFANPDLLKGALSREQAPGSSAAAASAAGAVDALRENASTADLLKPLVGLSLDAGAAAGGDHDLEADGEAGEENTEEFNQLMSRLESDFGSLDKAVHEMLKPSPEDESDPEVGRLKAQLRGFADKVDKADPAELGEALASTLRSLDESVTAHSRHTDAVRLPKPSAATTGAGGSGDGGGTEEVLMPFMENLMHTLLSKDVIYPSLQAIRDAYPGWLERNAATLSQADLDTTRRRITVIGEVCKQYEALGNARPSDQQFDQILHMVQQMQALGPPPEELLSDKDLPGVMPQCPQM